MLKFMNFLLWGLVLLGAGCASTPVNSEPEIILVGGATGRQGNAVVDELLARGYRVRGLTRKPGGKKAQRLKDKGVELVQGNYADSDSLLNAMDGIERMFFYSGFSRDEAAEGANVVAAAKASGIKQLVYSSGAAANPENGLQGAAKMQVELTIIGSGIPYTVFRPVAFMENFDRQQSRFASQGITDSRDPERVLHFISITDIGFLVGEAFDDPGQWLNRAENVASDKMTVEEYVATFRNVMGQDIAYNQVPLDEYLAILPKPLRPLFRWYDEEGYDADVVGLRAKYTNLTTLDSYLRATGWDNWQPVK
ncbi:MAG: NmrA/HSCARG family protein [Gammaproteobacteria bacterium]|nr:NmrA/HSCARG family protein [Gammaproteobacteria bacterium]MCP4928008.1 NmrA/HSCARG family protein [Gammaproteobacteria bacterium]